MNVNADIAKAGAWLLPLLSLCLLVVGARMAVAGVAAYQAGAFTAVWTVAARQPEPRAWQVASGAAQRAVAWYPVANGGYLDRLGQIHAWHHVQRPYGEAGAAESRALALNAYRKAVGARPTVPGTHARLAHTKLSLLEFDQEFRWAFAEAARLGPWQKDTHLELAGIGQAAWASLDEGGRRLTRKQIQLVEGAR